MITLHQRAAAAVIIITIISVFGCATTLDKQKKDQGPGAPAASESLPDESSALDAKDDLQQDMEEGDGIRPAPDYKIPPPPDDIDRTPIEPRIQREKDRMAKRAWEFSQNFKDVAYVKICYSREYLGWILHLFRKIKGKGSGYELYRWSKNSETWDLVRNLEPVKEDKLVFHVQVEVNEKCFLVQNKGGQIIADSVKSYAVDELMKDAPSSDKAKGKPRKPDNNKPGKPTAKPGSDLIKPKPVDQGEGLTPVR